MPTKMIAKTDAPSHSCLGLRAPLCRAACLCKACLRGACLYRRARLCRVCLLRPRLCGVCLLTARFCRVCRLLWARLGRVCLRPRRRSRSGRTPPGAAGSIRRPPPASPRCRQAPARPTPAPSVAPATHQFDALSGGQQRRARNGSAASDQQCPGLTDSELAGHTVLCLDEQCPGLAQTALKTDTQCFSQTSSALSSQTAVAVSRAFRQGRPSSATGNKLQPWPAARDPETPPQ
jgi:hypothetical protein